MGPVEGEVVPPNVGPIIAVVEPMARRGLGSKGEKVPILTNHFKVDVGNVDGHFYHYDVALFYDDGHPVEGKGVGRQLLEQVRRTYGSELDGKEFAYDGEKSLFTVGALPRKKFEFRIILDSVKSNRITGKSSPSTSDSKRMKVSFNSKAFKVEISFAAKITMQGFPRSQEALRVLDIVLRQHAARKGCLLVRQSSFHDDPRSFVDVRGGVLGCRGFHSSFRATQSGLSLNMDVSTTMIVKPGPVADFLVANQNVRDLSSVDWAKARNTLKNLRIKASPSNREFKITGLSDKTCRHQNFTLKQRNEDGERETEVTVYDYFVNHRKIHLRYSADFPCINVGKPKRPAYFPIELCSLLSLQRYTKALSTLQRSSLVEKSRQKPRERMTVLSNALKNNNYGSEPMLRSCGVSINNNFTQVEGRVLDAPKLKGGSGEDLSTRNGRWNFNKKRLAKACKIVEWAVVNFSAPCNVRNLVEDLKRVGHMKGVAVEDPLVDVIEENPELRRAPPVVRVEKMFEIIKQKLSGPPKFFLCFLPERKNCDIYGPWKRKCLSELGVVTQCLSPGRGSVNDQYLTNLLLKINAKLGGLNSVLAREPLPMISMFPTLIIGMDVSHGSPGQSDIPSIAAVVGSREWPSISRYRARVRTQSPKLEMIDSLYKPVSDSKDEGIMRELLEEFYTSSPRQMKPDQIIIFRDGVSESQFNQVLNIELTQIIKACNHLDDKWCPKFTVIVAQKNHHTKFFQPNSPDNVPPGTIIDNKVCHPKNNDFYLCAHAGMIGTTRPTHYHVLLDEVDFSPDDLQELVHSLSYVYQRSTTAISVVAPICYAHLAASQLGQWMKFEERSETASRQDGTAPPVPQMPPLKQNVRDSMFFC